ncbi:hypothetical protein E4U52_002173, partial [Claviceps spartinae]
EREHIRAESASGNQGTPAIPRIEVTEGSDESLAGTIQPSARCRTGGRGNTAPGGTGCHIADATRALQYRVDWEGADEDLEWYNAAKLKRWTPKLKIFHDANPNAVGPSCNFDKWLRHCETEEGPPPDAFGDNSPIKGMKKRPKWPTKGDILRDLKEKAAISKAAGSKEAIGNTADDEGIAD